MADGNNQSTARKDTVVPPPPRATGDPAADSKAGLDWLNNFFTSTVVASGLLDPSYQADAGTFDPNNLHDPTDSTIAKAQDTANRAYQEMLAIKQHLGI